VYAEKSFSAYTTKKLHELFSVTQRATKKLPKDDECMSKHVGAAE
jgi:hypothetical protein